MDTLPTEGAMGLEIAKTAQATSISFLTSSDTSRSPMDKEEVIAGDEDEVGIYAPKCSNVDVATEGVSQKKSRKPLKSPIKVNSPLDVCPLTSSEVSPSGAL